MNGLTKPMTVLIALAVVLLMILLLIFSNHEPIVPELTFEEQIEGALK